MTYLDILENGGKWLGSIRESIKIMKRNGENVTWGSNDILEPPMTIKEVEKIGAIAVESVINNPEQIDKPKPTEIQNQIIIYAKNWYGKSNNIINDLKQVISETTLTSIEYISKRTVLECIIDVFQTYVSEYDKKDALKHIFCYDKTDIFYCSPENAMISKISIIPGRYVNLQKMKPLNFGKDILDKMDEKLNV